MLKNISSRMFGALGASLIGLAVPVHAQQPMELEGDVKVVKLTIAADGSRLEELVPPDVVVPGDRLVFSTSYRNAGSDPVADFVVSNPLHEAVQLAGDADPTLTVSVDGGQTWGRIAELRVAGDDGADRAARPEDVTHVRWTLAKVGPGESGRLEYPAIIR